MLIQLNFGWIDSRGCTMKLIQAMSVFFILLVLSNNSYSLESFTDTLREGDFILLETKDLSDGEISYAIYEIAYAPTIKEFCKINLKHVKFHSIHSDKYSEKSRFGSSYRETIISSSKHILSPLEELKDHYKSVIPFITEGGEINVKGLNYKVKTFERFNALAADIKLINLASNDDWRLLYKNFPIKDEKSKDEILTLYPLKIFHPLIDPNRKFFFNNEWVRVRYISKREVDSKIPIILENEDGKLRVATNLCIQMTPFSTLVLCND